MISRARRIASSPAAQIALALSIGQILIYGSTPVLSRLYTAPQVGAASVFLAIASTAGGIGALRFEAQLAGAADAAANWVGRTALRLLSLTSAVVGVGYGVLNGPFDGVLMGLTMWSIGAVAVWTQWAARLGRMRGVAGSKLAQGLGQSVGQVTFGAAGVKTLGMQLGFAMGYAASALVQFLGIRQRDVSADESVPPAARGEAFRRGAYLTAATVMNLATINTPLFVMAHSYDRASAGHYSMAQRLAVAPAGLLVAALTPPILSAASARMREREALWPLALLWIRRLALPSLVINVAIALVPQSWVTTALGGDWGAVKEFLTALAPMTFGVLVLGPVSQLIAIAGFSGTQLVWDAGRLITIALTAALCVTTTDNPSRTTFVLSVVSLIFYGIYMYLIRAKLSRRGKHAAP